MAEDLSARLYARLPWRLQSCALTLFGVRNLRRRRAWHRILTRLAETERWTREQQRAFVALRLAEILEHAVRFVPRYQGYAHTVQNIRRNPGAAFEALQTFPPVTRDEILHDVKSFRSTAFEDRDLKRTHTSGTTGTPFTTWIESERLLESDALWWRRTHWAGYQPGDWIARLVGDPVIPLDLRTPDPPWRTSYSDRRLYLSTYHLSEATAPSMVDRLRKVRPRFIMGYPSALDALVRLSDRLGLTPGSWRPGAVFFSSEPLYDHQRQGIERFFRAPIRGLYGCAERILSAAECESGTYHLALIDGYLEGQFGEETAEGPARITGLGNRAMPLIRYEIGDSIGPTPDYVCPCGRTLPTMDAVVTKLEDNIVTPSGREISPSILTWAFKDVQGLEKSQIVQRSRTDIQILVKASPEFLPGIIDSLRSSVSRLTFGEMDIEITPTESLTVTESGKSRFVVNEYRQSLADNATDRDPS